MILLIVIKFFVRRKIDNAGVPVLRLFEKSAAVTK